MAVYLNQIHPKSAIAFIIDREIIRLLPTQWGLIKPPTVHYAMIPSRFWPTVNCLKNPSAYD
jgi:hypothetical protein